MSAIYALHVVQIAQLRSSVAAFVALWVLTQLGIEDDPSPVPFSQSLVARRLGIHERTVERHWQDVRELFVEVAPNLWLPRRDRWQDPHTGLEPGKQPQFFLLPDRLVWILLGLAGLGRLGFTMLRAFLPLIRRLRAAHYHAARGEGADAVSLPNKQVVRWLGLRIPSFRHALRGLAERGLVQVWFDGHRRLRGTWWLEPEPAPKEAPPAEGGPEPALEETPPAEGSPEAPAALPPAERSPSPPAERSPSRGDQESRESSTARASEPAPPPSLPSPPEPAAEGFEVVAEELLTAVWPEGSGRRGRFQDGEVLDGTPYLPALAPRAACELVGLGQLDSPEAVVAWLEQEAWGLRTADNPSGYLLSLARSGETRPGKPSGLELGWRTRAEREREKRRRGERARERREAREASLPADPEEREAFLLAERDAEVLATARAEHAVLTNEAAELVALVDRGIERVHEATALGSLVEAGTIELVPSVFSALDNGARLLSEALRKAEILIESTRDPWQDDQATEGARAEVLALYEATKQRVAAAVVRTVEARAMKEQAHELASSPALERAKRALEEREEAERQRERSMSKATARRWLSELKGALGIRSRVRR